MSFSPPVAATTGKPCRRCKSKGQPCCEAHAGDATTLAPKQQRFVDEYIVDLNATQAAIRAGYSKRTAHQIGYALLKKVEVADAVNEAMNDRAERVAVTADRVLHELARIAYANMAEFIEVQADGSAIVDLTHLTPDQAAAIQEVTSDIYVEGRGDDAVPVKKVKLKLHARSRALELLGKHLGLFTDRVEHTGAGGGPIDHQVTFYVPKNGRERENT